MRAELLNPTGAEARRRDMAACIHFLASEPGRIKRALRRHRPDSEDQCLDRCGSFPCTTFELAVAARRLHEERIRLADRLGEYPTQPIPAVTDARHRAPREVVVS